MQNKLTKVFTPSKVSNITPPKVNVDAAQRKKKQVIKLTYILELQGPSTNGHSKPRGSFFSLATAVQSEAKHNSLTNATNHIQQVQHITTGHLNMTKHVYFNSCITVFKNEIM